MFNNYLVVINATGNSWPEARKRALLLHCLGTEGQRIFNTLPDSGDTLASAITALEKHFNPALNVVAERHAFIKRLQGAQETILQYIAALRQLAATCEFGENCDDMIRDQLVEHVANPRIRERLLLKDKLDLTTAINEATQIEAATAQAKAMASDSRVSRRGQPTRPASKPASLPSASTCFQCGSDKHLANASECQAVRVICKSCGKKGHFARICQSTQSHSVKEVDVPEYIVLQVEGNDTPNKIQCTVDIQSGQAVKTVELTVDTGASVSVLPKYIYEKYFNDTPLRQSAVRLVTYSRTPINVLGCMQATVHMDGIQGLANFYVVDSGTALMGRDLISTLRLRIEGNIVYAPAKSVTPLLPTASVKHVTTTSPPTPIGCAIGFMHQVKVSPTAVPVRQKLRRLPFSVRSAVSEELDRLLSAGVIERIDSSPWVSPIVVIQKKTGGIRMCADLREPNKSIIIDSHPLAQYTGRSYSVFNHRSGKCISPTNPPSRVT